MLKPHLLPPFNMPDILAEYADHYEAEAQEHLADHTNIFDNVKASFLRWHKKGNLLENKQTVLKDVAKNLKPYYAVDYLLRRSINELKEFIIPNESDTEEDKIIYEETEDIIENIRTIANNQKNIMSYLLETTYSFGKQ